MTVDDEALPCLAGDDHIPLFSIIIPVYNTADYIGACIQSILRQDYKNFEIIAINDGSTDSSNQILDEFALIDKRVQVFCKDNEGQGAARNYGLSKAQGKYVAFVDSDDTISAHLLSRVFPYLSDDELDIVSFGTEFRNSAGQTVASRAVTTALFSSGDAVFLDAMLDRRFLSVVWNKVYRRSLLADNAIEFPPLRAYEDSVFSRHAARCARKVLYIPDVLYFALTRQGSTSRGMGVHSFSLAAEMIDLERKMFLTDVDDATLIAAFKAHVARFFAYLIVLSAFRIDDGRQRRICLKIADDAGFRTCADDRQAMGLLSIRARAQIFLARRPSLLRMLAITARRLKFAPY
jgi:glycosyltransferase involved in cell wall biosynthesis